MERRHIHLESLMAVSQGRNLWMCTHRGSWNEGTVSFQTGGTKCYKVMVQRVIDIDRKETWFPVSCLSTHDKRIFIKVQFLAPTAGNINILLDGAPLPTLAGESIF